MERDLKKLYPSLSPEEAAQAELLIEQYLALVVGIFERAEREGVLTHSEGTLDCTPPPSVLSE